MRELSGLVGALVLVGLMAGEVAAVEEPWRTSCLRYGNSTHETRSAGVPACQSQLLESEMPQEWLIVQDTQREPLVFEGELSAESQVFNSDGSYFNIHTFTGQAGETIKIDLVSDDFDALVILLDPDVNNIAQNDDGGENRNARIVITLPSNGEYSILANSYQAGEVGHYQITLQSATANDEVNHEIALRAAQLFQEGQTLIREGSLESLRAAIEKWEAAIPLYQQVGDRGGEAETRNDIGVAYDALGEKQRALEFFNQA
ncbi:MAG: pre-peptidase C-terminal domain-containing protein, partial [Spirulinaceae cyanobacterium]